MRLTRLSVQGFRCYRTTISIEMDSLVTLIGANDSGKSTLLEALEIFFSDGSPDHDDASVGADCDLEICCEFSDLPEQLVIDEDRPTTLASEYLLNENGQLEILKRFKAGGKSKAEVFAIAFHPTADGRDDLLSLSLPDLKKRAEAQKVDLAGVNKSVKAELRSAIWSQCDDLACKSRPIPLKAQTAKDVWDKLKPSLPHFALFRSDRPSTDQDSEAQDPMRAAVKEAIEARREDLDTLTQFVRREVTQIAKRTVDKLREVDPTLAGQLAPRFTDPKWDSVFKISLTGDDEVPVNKRGSGVRRMILMSFFRAKVDTDTGRQQPRNVIYAIEEPETSQHPNNQRLLLKAFQELADESRCQVIMTTHTPTIARLVPSASLRYISRKDDGSRNIARGDEVGLPLIKRTLGVIADHSVKLFIGVESPNDICFLHRLSKVLRKDDPSFVDLEELENNGEVIFIPLGGSNLALWSSRLAGFDRPEFYLCDRDNEPPKPPKYATFLASLADRKNVIGLHTHKRELENYLHPDAISDGAKALEMAVSVSIRDFDDVPELVAMQIHLKGNPSKPWHEVSEKKKSEKRSNAKRWLNSYAAAAMTRDRLEQRDPHGEVVSWFRSMSEMAGQ